MEKNNFGVLFDLINLDSEEHFEKEKGGINSPFSKYLNNKIILIPLYQMI